VNLISRFDPWRSPLCTCPPKLTFNLYTGCDHACLYCYASGYIPSFSDCRPKKSLLQRLEREAAGLKGETLSISNSSDPYPALEAQTGLMRKCLEILSQHDCKVHIVTKSDIVARDIDLLRNIPSMVSLTITTDDDNVAKLIEPCAPAPSERIKTVQTLVAKGIPTSVRIDPIIPFVNDDPETLVRTIASAGAKHITSSTYKVKLDNWKRLSEALPGIAEKLKPLYFDRGEKVGGNLCLPKDMRAKLMQNVSRLAEKHGVKFGTCREGLSCLNTATCDGSWLLHEGSSELV